MTPDVVIEKLVSLNSSKRTPKKYSSLAYGFEFEMEDVFLDINKWERSKECSRWRIDGDGSLRGESPLEFIALDGKPYDIALRFSSDLIEWVNTHCPRRILSERCSTHIHANCRFMSVQQMRYAVYLYLLVEPYFFWYAGTHRNTSPFCVPLSSCVAAIVTRYPELLFYKDFTLERFLNQTESWSKYAALNLGALQAFGTLEFRMFSGAGAVEEVSLWLKLVDTIMQRAITVEEEEIKRLILSGVELDMGEEILGSLGKVNSPFIKKQLAETRRGALSLLGGMEIANRHEVYTKVPGFRVHSHMRLEERDFESFNDLERYLRETPQHSIFGDMITQPTTLGFDYSSTGTSTSALIHHEMDAAIDEEVD